MKEQGTVLEMMAARRAAEGVEQEALVALLEGIGLGVETAEARSGGRWLVLLAALGNEEVPAFTQAAAVDSGAGTSAAPRETSFDQLIPPVPDRVIPGAGAATPAP